VTGGSYAFGKQAARAEQQRQDDAYYRGQQAAAAAPPPSASGGLATEDTARLAELGKLHEQGVLTDEEFAQQKARILNAP
jgi:hypothetical protein